MQKYYYRKIQYLIYFEIMIGTIIINIVIFLAFDKSRREKNIRRFDCPISKDNLVKNKTFL